MIRSATVVALLLVCLRAARADAQSLDPAALAEAFARAWTESRLPAFRTIATDDELALEGWRSVREALERRDCITVHAYEIESVERLGEHVIVRILIDADAVTRNQHRLRVKLPSRWRLTIDTESNAVIAAQNDADHLVALLLENPQASMDGYDATPAEVARSLYRRHLWRRQRPAAAEIARRILHEIRDPAAEMYATAVLARLVMADGDSDRAVAMMDDWIRARGNDVPENVRVQALIVAAQLGRYGSRTQGRKLLAAALARLDVITDTCVIADALDVDAWIAIEEFDFPNGLEAARRQQAFGNTYGVERARIDGHYHGTMLHRVLNNNSSAEPLFAENIEMSMRAADRMREAHAWLWYSRETMRPGAEPEVVRRLRRALELVPEEAADLRCHILADLAIYVNVPEADTTVVTMMEVFPDTEDPNARRNAQRTVAYNHEYTHGRTEEAIVALTEAIREGRGAMLWLMWTIKPELANWLRKLGRYDEALAHYREAIELAEARQTLIPMNVASGTRYFRNKIIPYRLYADFLAFLGRSEEALGVMERVRTRVLNEMLGLGRPQSDVTPEERETQRAMNERIVALNRAVAGERDPRRRPAIRAELAKAREELDRYDAELAIAHPARALRLSASALSLDQAVQPLPGNAIVEYAIIEHHLLIFVVTRNAAGKAIVRTRTVPIHYKELDQRILRFSRKLAQRDLGFAADAHALYDLLIRPVEPWLRGSRALHIVPDATLWLVPFQALMRDHEPLVRTFTISYAPSIGVLELLSRPRDDAQKPLTIMAMGTRAVANGTHDLPDAEDEVRRIARLYGGRGDLRVNGAARESVVKSGAASFEVLHFATHGELDDADPMYSALIFADHKSNAEDGRLEAREVAELDLHARVAVLSACDTAKGSIHSGEGVLGLAWSFLVAGCRTTVASQWKVPSKSTSQLMVEFHRRLLRGDSPAAALRAAQLEILRDPRFSHPFYWAGFVAIGAS